MEDRPFVSIVTPVYNGALFLRECIDSVLAQDYDNWEYLIVDNRSDDNTLEIAHSYAKRDSRVRVISNQTFVDVAASHNRAFGLISPRSQYCKVVSADDWIMPTCISSMVRFASAHPNVGIVGAYQQSGDSVRWRDLPATASVLSGRDACRLALLTGARVFGAPTAFLYRSDLLRRDTSFFPNSHPHADTSACYEALQHCDFGILHELLSTERLHAEQISTGIEKLGAGTLAYLEVLLEYGPRYLTAAEYAARKREVFDTYYGYLGGCLLKLEGRDFWRFQSSRLQDIGCRLHWGRVAAAAVKEALVEMQEPATAWRKIVAAVNKRLSTSQSMKLKTQ